MAIPFITAPYDEERSTELAYEMLKEPKLAAHHEAIIKESVKLLDGKVDSEETDILARVMDEILPDILGAVDPTDSERRTSIEKCIATVRDYIRRMSEDFPVTWASE